MRSMAWIFRRLFPSILWESICSHHSHCCSPWVDYSSYGCYYNFVEWPPQGSCFYVSTAWAPNILFVNSSACFMGCVLGMRKSTLTPPMWGSKNLYQFQHLFPMASRSSPHSYSLHRQHVHYKFIYTRHPQPESLASDSLQGM